jgi:ER lumen protein retaining receptor
MMNIFRFFGDMLHLASIILLAWKLNKSKSCVGMYRLLYRGKFCPVGVSCRTQEIYLLVFVARYLDLFWLYVSFYNTGMSEKLLSCLIV